MMRDQELQDEYDAQFGDPRRCKFHPHVKTSSGDGLFDAPCYECEGEMNDAQWDANNADATDGDYIEVADDTPF